MKKISYALMIAAIVLVFSNCERGSDNPNPSGKAGFTVMTNSADPLITTYTDGNKQIDFFGTRDANGLPVNVDHIVVKKPNDTTYYKLDATGRPTNVYTQNGTQFEFNWIAPQKAALTILASDGSTQLNTELDFSGSNRNSAVNVSQNSIRAGKSVTLNYQSTANTFPGQSLLTENANCAVNVNSCGAPSDAQVYVVAKEQSGKMLGYFPALRTSKGKYAASIPTNLAPTLNLSEICGSVVGAMDYVCIGNEMPGFYTGLCVQISAAVAASGIGAAIAPEIFAACAAVTTGIELYCSTVGASPAPGEPSLAEMMCNADVLNRTFSQDIVIAAKAISIPNNTYSTSVVVAGSGPFPDLNLDMGMHTAIRTLVLNPVSPTAGQNYSATCDVFCLQAASTVKLTVVGTDGYTDSIVYPIANQQPEGQFTLTVPGAATGVRDNITLEITLASGSVLNRSASLVFN